MKCMILLLVAVVVNYSTSIPLPDTKQTREFIYQKGAKNIRLYYAYPNKVKQNDKRKLLKPHLIKKESQKDHLIEQFNSIDDDVRNEEKVNILQQTNITNNEVEFNETRETENVGADNMDKMDFEDAEENAETTTPIIVLEPVKVEANGRFFGLNLSTLSVTEGDEEDIRTNDKMFKIDPAHMENFETSISPSDVTVLLDESPSISNQDVSFSDLIQTSEKDNVSESPINSHDISETTEIDPAPMESEDDSEIGSDYASTGESYAETESSISNNENNDYYDNYDYETNSDQSNTQQYSPETPSELENNDPSIIAVNEDLSEVPAVTEIIELSIDREHNTKENDTIEEDVVTEHLETIPEETLEETNDELLSRNPAIIIQNEEEIPEIITDEDMQITVVNKTEDLPKEDTKLDSPIDHTESVDYFSDFFESLNEPIEQNNTEDINISFDQQVNNGASSADIHPVTTHDFDLVTESVNDGMSDSMLIETENSFLTNEDFLSNNEGRSLNSDHTGSESEGEQIVDTTSYPIVNNVEILTSDDATESEFEENLAETHLEKSSIFNAEKAGMEIVEIDINEDYTSDNENSKNNSTNFDDVPLENSVNGDVNSILEENHLTTTTPEELDIPTVLPNADESESGKNQPWSSDILVMDGQVLEESINYDQIDEGVEVII